MRFLVAPIAASTLWAPPSLANTCEEEYAYCYYLASLESDERARDAKQNDCDLEYWICTSQALGDEAPPAESTTSAE
jgi:hypothetical protein